MFQAFVTYSLDDEKMIMWILFVFGEITFTYSSVLNTMVAHFYLRLFFSLDHCNAGR